jgi:hypothetical protein
VDEENTHYTGAENQFMDMRVLCGAHHLRPIRRADRAMFFRPTAGVGACFRSHRAWMKLFHGIGLNVVNRRTGGAFRRYGHFCARQALRRREHDARTCRQRLAVLLRRVHSIG